MRVYPRENVEILAGDSGPNDFPLPFGLTIDLASSNGNVILRWDQNQIPTSTEVWQSINGGAFVLLTTVAGTARSAVDTTLMNSGDIFTYKVRAVYLGVNSAFSNTASIGLSLVNTVGPVVSFPDLILDIGAPLFNGSATITSILLPLLQRVVGGDLSMNSNPNCTLININQLRDMNGANLLANGNTAQLVLSLPSATSLVPILEASNSGLTTLNCPLMTSSLQIDMNTMPALVTVNLQNLASISGSLIFINCPLIRTLDFSLLTVVGAELHFEGSTALTTLLLTKLVSVAGPFMAFNCVNLTSLSMPLLGNVNNKVDFHGCTRLTRWFAPLFIPQNGFLQSWNACALDELSVNLILARCRAAGVTICTINLAGGTNSPPTGQGLLDKAALIAAGNTVTTN